MMFNTLVDNTVWILRNAYKKSKAPIWKALEQEIAGPKNNRREVNVGRLAQITRESEVVVVGGKVLGAGTMDHKLTVCAFSISESAAKKIVNAGGRILHFDELVKSHPDGRGVRIIG
jgi:large subunit ribosomal protein L18e